MIELVRGCSLTTKWNNNKIGYFLDFDRKGVYRFIESDDMYGRDYTEADRELPVVACGFIGYLLKTWGSDFSEIKENYLKSQLEAYRKKHNTYTTVIEGNLERDFFQQHEGDERQRVNQSQAIYEFLAIEEQHEIQACVDSYFEYFENRRLLNIHENEMTLLCIHIEHSQSETHVENELTECFNRLYNKPVKYTTYLIDENGNCECPVGEDTIDTKLSSERGQYRKVRRLVIERMNTNRTKLFELYKHELKNHERLQDFRLQLIINDWIKVKETEFTDISDGSKSNNSKNNTTLSDNPAGCWEEEHKEVPEKAIKMYNFWKEAPDNNSGYKNLFAGISIERYLDMIKRADFGDVPIRNNKNRLCHTIYLLSGVISKEWGERAAQSIGKTLSSKNTNYIEYDFFKKNF